MVCLPQPDLSDESFEPCLSARPGSCAAATSIPDEAAGSDGTCAESRRIRAAAYCQTRTYWTCMVLGPARLRLLALMVLSRMMYIGWLVVEASDPTLVPS